MTDRSDFYPAGDMYDVAVDLLCTWPGMVDKIETCIRREPDPDPSYPSCSIDWARVAELAFNSPYSSAERAFLGVCAEIAGHPVRSEPNEAFAIRFTRLDGSTQRLVARVLTQLADATLSREQAVRQVFGS